MSPREHGLLHDVVVGGAITTIVAAWWSQLHARRAQRAERYPGTVPMRADRTRRTIARSRRPQPERNRPRAVPLLLRHGVNWILKKSSELAAAVTMCHTSSPQRMWSGRRRMNVVIGILLG
jgi:hypothetical protein